MLYFLWRHISDEWITSKTAACMLGASATLSIALTPVFWGDVRIVNYGLWNRVLWGSVGILTPASIFFNWFGMWRYWARNDTSGTFARRLSFILLIVGVWFGAAIYYAAVYLPQVRQNWKRQPEGAL
jgi:hypothetical protein